MFVFLLAFPFHRIISLHCKLHGNENLFISSFEVNEDLIPQFMYEKVQNQLLEESACCKVNLKGWTQLQTAPLFNFHGQSKNHISLRFNLDESLQLEIIL